MQGPRVSMTLSKGEYRTLKRWSDNLGMKPATLAKMLIFSRAKKEKGGHKKYLQLEIGEILK